MLTDIYTDFISLINDRRKNTKLFNSFETRFDAFVAKFKLHGEENAFLEPLLALQLLNAAHVEDGQRVSILAVCVNIMKTDKTNPSTQNSVFIKNTSYSTVAGVLRQCDSRGNCCSIGGLTARSGRGVYSSRGRDARKGGGQNTTGNHSHNRHQGGVRCSPAKILQIKIENPYHKCGKYSRWSDAHNEDCLLKPGTLSHVISEAAKAALTAAGKNDSRTNNKNETENKWPVMSFIASLSNDGKGGSTDCFAQNFSMHTLFEI